MSDFDDGGRSKALQANTQSFLTSFAFNGVIAGVQLIAWLVLRPLIKGVYEPRTYIPPHIQQALPLGKNLIMPLWRIIMSDPEEILHKNGVDPYVFVRFLRLMCKAFIPIWIVSWIILLPVDSVNSTHSGREGLDRFTFGNVAPELQSRYWAHLIMAWVFNGWIIYLVWTEMRKWLVIRQQYLTSPKHSRTAQARTVLVTSIPKEYMDEEKLKSLYAFLPGGVKTVWLNRNLKEMPALYNRRLKAAEKLENAQVALVQKAWKYRHKHEQQVAKAEKKGREPPPLEPATKPPTDGAALSLADQLVPHSQRPTMRLKPDWSPISLGWLGIGKKVDVIHWARKEIAECTDQLDRSRDQLGRDIATVGVEGDNYPPLNSAFILFNQQIAAHMAHQCLNYQEPYRMNRRFIEQAPSNIIWNNMRINSYEARLRSAVSWALTIGIIIAWVPLSSFLGIMASAPSLTEQFAWMRWILGDSFGKKLLQGVITGVLPPVLLALLNMLVPVIYRQFSSLAGTPNKNLVELDVMTRFFIHLVVNTFVTVTLSKGLIQSLPELASNPTSVPAILAQNMPSASTFFITMILTQFTGAVGVLLSPITLLLYYVRVILGGGTPRKIFNARYRMPTPTFGADFARLTAYCMIMSAYMIISPVINGFGAVFAVVSYIVYKYQYIWVMFQRPSEDTGGLFFPKAVSQVFVGLYIQEICLCALFFLARNEKNKVSAVPQGALMVVLIFCTMAVHFILLNAYGPLLDSVPFSLAHLTRRTNREIANGTAGSKTTADDQSFVSAKSQSPLNPTPPNGRIGHGTEKEEAYATSSKEGYATESKGSPSSAEHPVHLSEHGVKHHYGEHLGDETKPSLVRRSTTRSWDDIKWDSMAQDWQPGRQGDSPPPSAAAIAREHAKEEIELAELGRTTTRVDPEDESEEAAFFAVPGGPGVYPPPPTGLDPAAFFHPATKNPQRTVWLPQDTLGMAAHEMRDNVDAGVLTTTNNAFLNSNGKVKVVGRPPDLIDM